MPLSPEVALVVEEALVAQSSGRLQPQLGGRVRGGLRFGAFAVDLELAATGTWLDTTTRDTDQLQLRPGLLVEGELRRGPFGVALGLGPALVLRRVAWEGVEPWWDLDPAGRVLTACRWDLGATLALELDLGATVRWGGPDYDLGLGLRWSP